MRVLLMNSNRFHQPWPVIPFGLCCVASAAEAAGHEVRVLDLCFSRRPALVIAESVARFRPDAVGVSVRNIDNSAGFNTLFLLDGVRDEVIAPLKRVFAGPIVIGGPAVGINAAEMLDFFGLEYAIRGDGEASFVEFLRRFSGGESLEELGGLVVRRGGRIVQDSPPLCVEDLDSLPGAMPQRWIGLKPYRRCGSPLQVQTKRGCVLGCTYCTYSRIEGRAWRLRSPTRVADEIETLIRETGIRDIEFTDSTFNLPLDHCKAVLREVVSRGVRANFRTMGLNPGAVDEELGDLLKAAGFKEVDLGAEAGCDAALRSLGKNFRKESLLRAGRLLRDRGIPVTWYLLVGAPVETRDSLAETFATINRAAAPWDLVNVGVGIRAYRGSTVAENMKAAGAVAADEGFLRPVAVEPEDLSLAEVKTLTKREALRRANYFMYDEDEKTPLVLTVLVTWLLRVFRSRQPVWRAFILLRKVQMWTGLNALKRLAFERRNRQWAIPHRGEASARKVAIPEAGRGGFQVAGSKRILFVGEAVSLAHVARPAVLARWAKEAGHEVGGGYRFGPSGEFSVRLASTTEDRWAAWALAYRVYREKGYAEPNPQGLWYSIHDALPGTVTVLVERQETTGHRLQDAGLRLSDHEDPKPDAQGPEPAVLIGAVTVVPDSPIGLPADKVFPEETGRLRASGAKLAEAVSLVQGNLSDRAGMLVAAKLCEFTCLVAERLLGATDLVITVNPRHESYYRRVMLFERCGAEAPCDKVSGAPAVFLSLNFTEMQRHIERSDLPGAPKTIYRRFMKSGEAEAAAATLRRQMRPLDEAPLRRFFQEERPLLGQATPEGRAHIQDCHLAWDFEIVGGPSAREGQA
jgi:hypothetical protein